MSFKEIIGNMHEVIQNQKSGFLLGFGFGIAFLGPIPTGLIGLVIGAAIITFTIATLKK